MPSRLLADTSAPPSLLLLHGFLGRGADWAPFADRLRGAAAGRGVAVGEIVAPDLPGHGAAVGLDRQAYTLAGAADALAARLDTHHDAPADVVGYSMGGRLAVALALRHPACVRRLVLLSASPGLGTATARAARRRLDAERAAEIARDLPGFVDRWAAMPLFVGLPAALRTERTAQQTENDPAELARSLAGMGTGAQASYWDALDRLPGGTLAVAGGLDAAFVGVARAMAERSGGRVRAVVVPSVGHAPHLEAPGATARLVLDALAADGRPPGASPPAPR